MPVTPNPSNLSELTVTCHQCGSADMERLDRKEYRCKHCGAITVISDDDADRVEDLLTQALSRTNFSPAPPSTPVKKSGGVASVLIPLFIVGAALGIPALISVFENKSSGSGGFDEIAGRTVPVEDVAVSQLTWNDVNHRYEGMVYNHSGFAVDIPRFNMTLFTNGHRSGATWSEVSLDRLLPGEYEPITFDPRTLGSDTQPDRYELDKPDQIDRNTDEVAHLDVTQQQLVKQDGKDFYKFVGIVRNTLTRPVDGPRVLIVLYGPDHQVLASGAAFLEALRPGENGLIDEDFYPHPGNVPVAAYEYLVDATFTDNRR
jgi:hypothetical protein